MPRDRCRTTLGFSQAWSFFVNLPIGIAMALAARRLVEDRRGVGTGHGADALVAAS